MTYIMGINVFIQKENMKDMLQSDFFPRVNKILLIIKHPNKGTIIPFRKMVELPKRKSIPF